MTISDGTHSLECSLQGTSSAQLQRLEHAIVQVNEFSVVTSRNNKKMFQLVDFDEIASNPGEIIGNVESIENLNVRCDVLRAKEILARQIIADFMWRCNEQGKVRAEKARKVIGDLLWKGIALQRRQQLRSSVVLAQKLHRGRLARKVHFEPMQRRLEEFRRFTSIWEPAIEQVPESSEQTLSGWSLVREKIDLKKVEEMDDDGNFAETDQKLSQALAGAMQENDRLDDSSVEDEEVEDEDMQDDNETTPSNNGDISSVPVDWSKFQVSSHVVKFIKKGDMLYRDIFVMRMKQLAKGEWSHKIRKPLKGCESVICEYISVLLKSIGFLHALSLSHLFFLSFCR